MLCHVQHIGHVSREDQLCIVLPPGINAPVNYNGAIYQYMGVNASQMTGNYFVQQLAQDDNIANGHYNDVTRALVCFKSPVELLFTQ